MSLYNEVILDQCSNFSAKQSHEVSCNLPVHAG